MMWMKYVVGAGAAAAALDYGVAAYFFRRTILRQHAATERTMKMSGTDWSQYFPMMEERREKMMAHPHEDVYVTSQDGLKLHGTFFPGEGKKTVICFHGYTSKGMNDYVGLSGYYLPRGYNLLLVDERAHGDSEGTYIGFGTLDRKDGLCWIRYIQERLGEDCEIWLHGMSMGAATVVMMSGLALPACVKGIISDCAFTCAWDVFEHVLHSMYHLPAYPILAAAEQMMQKRAGYGLKTCDASQEVKKAKVPILLLHGEKDTFVPCEMSRKIYRNCASSAKLVIIPGAGHCEAYYKNPELYEKELTDFIS